MPTPSSGVRVWVLSGLSASEDGLRAISAADAKAAVRALVAHVDDDLEGVSLHCLSALVNLSCDAKCVQVILDCKAWGAVMEVLGSSPLSSSDAKLQKKHQSALMLLSNLTGQAEGAGAAQSLVANRVITKWDAPAPQTDHQSNSGHSDVLPSRALHLAAHRCHAAARGSDSGARRVIMTM